MRLLTYQLGGALQIGVLSQDCAWVFPIRSVGVDYPDMKALIRGITEEERERLEAQAAKRADVASGAVRLEQVQVQAPIPHPEQDIICLGVNYMAHAEESARYKKEEFDGERPHAIYFSKRVNEAVADGQEIQSHPGLVERLDYEVELAVILAKDAKNVPKVRVKDYLFGYTILNDVSARDIQTRHKQWYFGKSLDGFTPMGPNITTIEELPYPPKLRIQSKVNGELRQDSSTEFLIFDIDFVVSELSQGMTLKVGTIISMGTPSGVGMGFDPPRFLVPGDEVECIIEGIGSLKNRVGGS